MNSKKRTNERFLHNRLTDMGIVVKQTEVDQTDDFEEMHSITFSKIQNYTEHDMYVPHHKGRTEIHTPILKIKKSK